MLCARSPAATTPSVPAAASTAPSVVTTPLSPELAERDSIASWLVLSLVERDWQTGSGAEIRGHNIGALGVDGAGRIRGHAFNENHRHGASTEHAELRLIRKLFEDLRASGARGDYSRALSGYTVYTTLEPCSMCAGALDLANVARVVFVQADPSQKGIAQHLRALHGAGAAEPIAASVSQGASLNDACQGSRQSIVAFLRGDAARAVFRSAQGELERHQPAFAENAAFLAAARAYATSPPP
jgi:tRNA(Arg) A34 adenosine deaminase TadA